MSYYSWAAIQTLKFTPEDGSICNHCFCVLSYCSSADKTRLH